MTRVAGPISAGRVPKTGWLVLDRVIAATDRLAAGVIGAGGKPATRATRLIEYRAIPTRRLSEALRPRHGVLLSGEAGQALYDPRDP